MKMATMDSKYIQHLRKISAVLLRLISRKNVKNECTKAKLMKRSLTIYQVNLWDCSVKKDNFAVLRRID